MEPLEGKMTGGKDPGAISTKRQRIATLAGRNPKETIYSLAHHMDVEWLHEAYRRTRKDGAPGVDGRTAAEYEQELQGNLERLLDRAKSGAYRAPPVKRVHIPKGRGGETRPIGIPTLEDKVLQRAVVMLLEPVYEQDFQNCSYGFRPGRSAHQALEAFWQQAMIMGGGWLVEVDIRKFFDTLDHGRLREILRARVSDGVLLRLVGKWLNAGVLEQGTIEYPESGTPQGGVISPLLANIYLHEVLDGWFARDVMPRLYGKGFLVRYADDFVMLFSQEADAKRVMNVLPKRFGKYGLTLHPEKTRLVPFRRPPRSSGGKRGGKGPGCFDLLGFTHYWGRSRKGSWVIKRKTAGDRLSRSLMRIAHWCRRMRHSPVSEQHAGLARKLKGHYGYFGITGNSQSLYRFLRGVERRWRYWLSRRGQRRKYRWDWFMEILKRFPLPEPVVVHSVLRRSANP
jgi:RNA-directed DNA polymerase